MSLDPANQLRIEEIRAVVAEICGHDVTPILEALDAIAPRRDVIDAVDGAELILANRSRSALRAVRDIKQGEFVRFAGDSVVYTREHYVRSERRFCLSRVDGTGDRFVSAEKMLIVGFTY